MSDQKIYGSRQEALAAMRKFKEATEEIAKILGVSTYTTITDDAEEYVGIIYHEAYYLSPTGRTQAVIKPSNLTDIFKNGNGEQQAGLSPIAMIIEEPSGPLPPWSEEIPPRNSEPI